MVIYVIPGKGRREGRINHYRVLCKNPFADE